MAAPGQGNRKTDRKAAEISCKAYRDQPSVRRRDRAGAGEGRHGGRRGGEHHSKLQACPPIGITPGNNQPHA